MIKKLTTLIIFTSFTIVAQKRFSKEFSFYNDNDLYVSIKKDRYYTNGLFLSYRYLSNSTNKKVTKRIYEFQIGQEMYTPFKATVDLKGEHDRPFAAHLFGSFGVNRFYKNNSALKTSLLVGVIGPNAQGRELQDFIHEIYDYKKAIGWDYQITNAISINLNTNYQKHLISNSSKTLDLTWSNKLRIGTVYTDLSSGIYTRIGLKPLQDFINTVAFNSNLNNATTKTQNISEFFLFINPMLHYVIYDATIQGSFLNNSSPITFDTIPFKFTTQIGLLFSASRFNFGYLVNYHTKKLKNTKVPSSNFYGTILINYQFN